MSQLIVIVTAIHEQVGQLVIILNIQIGLVLDWKKERDYGNSTIYTYLYIDNVYWFRVPPLYDKHDQGWIHLFEDNQHYEQVCKIYHEFRDDLGKLEKIIDDRNEKRKYPIQSFNPRYLECSVSI